MAAITPFLDRTRRTESVGTPDDACPSDAPGGPLPSVGDLLLERGRAHAGMGSLGVVRDVPALEVSHAELTRTVWIRQGLEEELLTGLRGGEREFWIESDCRTGELFFHLSPLMQKDILPWYAGVGDIERFSLFGSNGKMKCPTWDLPAGSPFIGGSCPGATAGQTVVEPEKRYGALAPDRRSLPVVTPGFDRPQVVNERTAICQQCYALEGNYPSPHVQVGEIIRYWWSRDMLSSGRVEEWVETMVAAVGALNIPATRHGIRPIRVHSSGDFFSPAYAQAWMEVANRVWALEEQAGRDPQIRFWAPTRAWAVRGFDWAAVASHLRYLNMIVRPSSYHVDDPAPGALVRGWAMGATSVITDHKRPRDARYDWDCGTYAIRERGGGDLAPSCADATAPDGRRGCRACWTEPRLRINYTTH